jgi:hypothetical protein
VERKRERKKEQKEKKDKYRESPFVAEFLSLKEEKAESRKNHQR